MEHCMECERSMPTTHWHYEEFDDLMTPHPVDAWEEFVEQVSERKITVPTAEPTEPEIKASLTHTEMRLDGSDFICDACGAVSGDFELFEEVGVEVGCKPVEHDKVVKSPKSSKQSEMLKDLYEKLLREVTDAEAKARAKAAPKPKSTTWDRKTEIIQEVDDMVAKHLARKRDASHKTRYIEIARELQRKERRK